MATYPAAYGNVNWGAAPPQKKKTSTLKVIGTLVAVVAIGFGIVFGIDALTGSKVLGVGTSVASGFSGVTGGIAEATGIGSAFETVGKTIGDWLGLTDSNLVTGDLPGVPTAGEGEMLALNNAFATMEGDAVKLLDQAQSRVDAAAKILTGGDTARLFDNYPGIEKYMESLQKLAAIESGAVFVEPPVTPAPSVPSIPQDGFFQQASLTSPTAEIPTASAETALPSGTEFNLSTASEKLALAKEHVAAMQQHAGDWSKLGSAVSDQANLMFGPDGAIADMSNSEKAGYIANHLGYADSANGHLASEQALLKSSGETLAALNEIYAPDGLSGTTKALIGGTVGAGGTALLMSGGKKCDKQAYGPHSSAVLERRARIQEMMNQQGMA